MQTEPVYCRGAAAEEKAGFGCPLLFLQLLPGGEVAPSLQVVEALPATTGRPPCLFYGLMQALGI